MLPNNQKGVNIIFLSAYGN